MHANSLKSFDEGARGPFSKREQAILDFLHQRPTTFWTDRQIAEKLGFSDLNCVRPRITRLVEVGALVEGPSVKCGTTGKTVRQTAIPLADPKQTLIQLSA